MCVIEKFAFKTTSSVFFELNFFMDKTKEQLEKLREVAEASLTKTDELQKVLAQIEALMSREESKTLLKKK